MNIYIEYEYEKEYEYERHGAKVKQKTAAKWPAEKNLKILFQHPNILGIILFQKFYMNNFQKCQIYIL